MALTQKPPTTPDGVSIAFYGADGARVELIELSDPSALAARLAGATARIDHIALEGDDVEAVVAQPRLRGVRFMTEEPARIRDLLSIRTVPESSAGISWQLFSRIPAAT